MTPTPRELDALAEAAFEASHAEWLNEGIDRLEADALDHGDGGEFDWAPDAEHSTYSARGGL